MARLSQHVCGLLGQEKEGVNHSSMWEALLVYFHAFPRAWTTTGGGGGGDVLRSQLLPHLTRLIRSHFLGSASASCPSLLPLLAQIPPELACPPSSSSSSCAYVEVMEALWKGSKDDAKDGPAPYLSAVLEIATYLLLRPDPPSALAALGPSLLEQAMAVVRAAMADGPGLGSGLKEDLTTALTQVGRSAPWARQDRRQPPSSRRSVQWHDT